MRLVVGSHSPSDLLARKLCDVLRYTAGKFDRELNLAVWRLGLKPPNYNPPILFSPAHNM